MMRTSNLFPLARRYSKQKARSRVQSTTNGGKLLTGLFLFCCGYSRGKKEKCDVSIFLSCTHKKIERGVCFQYNVFCIEARIEFFWKKGLTVMFTHCYACDRQTDRQTDRQVNSALFSILSIINRTHRLSSYKGEFVRFSMQRIYEK